MQPTNNEKREKTVVTKDNPKKPREVEIDEIEENLIKMGMSP